MPAVKLSPIFNSQVIDAVGDPASGWKVYTYAAGSSTPLAAYTDATGNVAQSNPIVINALGFPTNGQIWLQDGLAYKLVLTDANDVVQKTQDNITGVNDTGVTANQWQASGVSPTYVSATTFTLSGDQTSDFHVGRRLQFQTTAGIVYGTILTSAYTSLTTVTMAMDGIMELDSGLSAVNVSLLRVDHLAVPLIPAVSSTDAGKALIVNKLGTGYVPAVGALSDRNKIINGNFSVNQRTVTGTVVLTAGQYGHDRWKAGASGCTYTFAIVDGATTLTISAGTLQQVIEGANLQSGTHVMSWGGTAQGKIGAGSLSISGVTESVTGGTNLTVEFSTGTLSLVQLEIGAVPTQFAHESIDRTLTRCLRYYERDGRGMAGQAVSSTVATLNCFFKVTKRAPPTLTQLQSGFNMRIAGSTTSVSGTLTSSGMDATGAALAFTLSSGTWTAGQEVSVNDAVIAAFDAEL